MANLKCLIIEDEALIAFQLKVNLTRAGFVVSAIAARGDQAIEAARKDPPDVILVDIRLLGAMDGIEAASQIRQFSSAHIIFTTGYSDPQLKDRAMALNPVAYLVKPVEVSEVIAVLKPIVRDR